MSIQKEFDIIHETIRLLKQKLAEADDVAMGYKKQIVEARKILCEPKMWLDAPWTKQELEDKIKRLRTALTDKETEK